MRHDFLSRSPGFMGQAVRRPARCGLAVLLLVTKGCGGGAASSDGGVPDAAGVAPGLDSAVADVGHVPADGGNVADAGGTPSVGPATEISCRELTAPASGLCSITPGANGLLLRG